MTRAICRDMCGIDLRDLSPLQVEPRLLDHFPGCASLVPSLIQKLDLSKPLTPGDIHI